jgi:hypothetical protein
MTSSEWDVRSLGGLMMSDLVEGYVDAFGVKMRGSTLRFQAQYLRMVHIPRADEVDEETLRRYLCTRDYPDPDLLIRTGGELRISNFLLWQMAYTELYFSEQLWPDFRHEDFYDAVLDYQSRQRRFGKTEAQVEAGQ